MGNRSNLNSNRLIAATATESNLQAENADKYHNPNPREYQAFFMADAVSVFVGVRTQYAFAWREVSFDALMQSAGGVPVLVIASLTK